ncbi:MAG TPA: ABC transporter permease subunit [Ktedonobacteraceae bacterium]|jgi:ABC-type transport system involved in multi-copper enzyme maturation permease subunit
MGLWYITRFTLQEAIRRRLFLAVAVLSILLLIMYAFIVHFVTIQSTKGATLSGENLQLFLLVGGIFISVPSIWMVYLISGILTIFLAVGMISSEIEAGTFAIIVPKPLRRYEIVLGKWAGHVLLLGGYTALLFLAFLGIIYWLTGYWPDEAFSALGLLELAMLTLLGLATLGSTLVSTVVNGAIALILFVSAPLASFISTVLAIMSSTQSVTLTPSPSLQNIITVINLIIPTDALWHGAAYWLLPTQALNLLPSQDVSTAFFNLPLINAEQMSTPLLIWVALYIIVLPALAVWRFQKRDL